MKKITLRFISIILLLNVLWGNLYAFKASGVKQKDINVTDLNSVACIFAGRKKYLSILMVYLNKLMELGKLKEVHFWQFTNNKDDVKYLESIANLHKTSKNFTEYRTIKPIIRNNEINLKIKAKNDAHILINNTYEIVIGGWNNSKSVIRLGPQGKTISEVPFGDLDAKRYKNFTIGIRDNSLYVQGLMNAKVKENRIKSVKIHTGGGSEGYWDYEEAENKGRKLFDTEKRIGFHKYPCTTDNWGEAYKFYLNYDFDLLLKIDDDIVYMDLDRYDEYIKYIVRNPHKTCVFPNMVNHAVSLFYNNKNNLIPNKILFDKYRHKKHPDDLYWYYNDGKQAIKVHEYFLNNINKFIHNNINPINLDGHKESICMLGILKHNYHKIFDKNIGKVKIKGIDGKWFTTNFKNFLDEIYVYNCKGNVLYPKFVACHYQFGPQMKSGLDERFLPKYKKLAHECVVKK